MFYVTTKTSQHTDGSKYRVLATTEKRASARTQAAALGGTVRTQAEIDELGTAGRLDKTTLPGYVAPEPAKAEPKASGRWGDMAKDIAASHRKATTLGKKERVLKRPPTPQAVLDEASQFLDSIAAENKVEVVRKLAVWKSTTGVGLQRRDAMSLLNKHVASISDNTISTQWFWTKSGRVSPKA